LQQRQDLWRDGVKAAAGSYEPEDGSVDDFSSVLNMFADFPVNEQLPQKNQVTTIRSDAMGYLSMNALFRTTNCPSL